MKKIVVSLLLALVLLASACSGAPAAEEKKKIDIIADGASDYTVIVPEDASEAELYAAQELKDFVRQATGVSLPQETDAGKTLTGESRYLVIGDSQLKEAAGIVTDASVLGTDGFVIENEGNSLFLGGAADRGTLYSVYEFLEKAVGVRFLAIDETYVPEVKDVSVYSGRDEQVPAFQRRDVHFYPTINNADFAARMRLNGVRTDLTAKHGYGSKQEWSENWAHTLYMLLPPEEYYEDHPDWYGNVPYEEVTADGNKRMCLTNDELVAELVKNLKQWIIDQPNAKYFAVAQEDNSSPCSCSNCQASDAKYTFTGSMLNFVNKVARQIEEWRRQTMPEREILIEMFAYQETELPPVKLNENNGFEILYPELEVEDNVVVRIAPIWSCFSHDLFDPNCPDNSKSRQIFEGWGAICDKIIMWTYCNNFENYIMYFNNFRTIASNYQTFVENNVIEILDQGAFDTPRTNLQELRIYIQSKLQWDPYQDVNALIEEFCNLYYGVAGSYVLDFIELWNLHYAAIDTQSYMHFWCWDNYDNVYAAENYPRRFLEQSMNLFDEALERISVIEDDETREKLQERVTAVSLIPRYYVMINYDTYYDAGTKQAFVDQWFDDAEYVGLTRISEGVPTSALYEEIMAEE